MKKIIILIILLSIIICGCSNDITRYPDESTTDITFNTRETSETDPPLFIIETTYDPFSDMEDWFEDPIQLPDVELE